MAETKGIIDEYLTFADLEPIFKKDVVALGILILLGSFFLMWRLGLI